MKKNIKKISRILHIVSVREAEVNGVATAVRKYSEYESEHAKTAVLSLDEKIHVSSNVAEYNSQSYKTISSLPDGFDKPSIVIFNELYKLQYLKLYKECIDSGIPYVIIPHGCMTKMAQNKKWFKKWIANILAFNRFVKNASAIQFLNQKEMNDTVLKYKKAIISGNGIDAEYINLPNKPKAKDFVYIGRYDTYVKGLDLVVDVCTNNAVWFRKENVRIMLYGRNTSSNNTSIADDVKRNGISDILVINDEVHGKKKENILADAYAFIQTSRHEGQPMGVMEALSKGLPCVVTYGTSFGEYVNDNKCGVGVPFDEKEVFKAIKQLSDDIKYRDECSLNTRAIIKDYSWKTIINNCVCEYGGLI